MSKSMRISVEVDVHAVTCPGVWFPCKSPVHLSICFLGFHVKTKPFPATFPLLFGDKFVLEKTFPGCSTLHDLQSTLENQSLYVELLQELSPGHSVVLATFETSVLEFLFPYPQLRPTYTSGVDVDLLMEPTRDFPGIISPKIEASTRTHINETRHAHIDQLHDSAVTLNQVPPMDKHPHLSNSRSSSGGRHEHNEPFVWRKVEDDLIARKPTAHQMDSNGHHYHQPESGPPTPMRRSKSFASGNEPSHEHRPRSRTRNSGHCQNNATSRPSSPPSRSHSVHGPRPPIQVHRDFGVHHNHGHDHTHGCSNGHSSGGPPSPHGPPLPHGPPPPLSMPQHHPEHSHRPLPPLPVTPPHHTHPHPPPIPTGLCHPDLHTTHCPPDFHPLPSHHHPHYNNHPGCHCSPYPDITPICGPSHHHDHPILHMPANRCSGVAHCQLPLCSDPQTCPYSCHVDGHPSFPHPPSSTPHLHSKHIYHHGHHGTMPCCGPCCS